MSIESLRAQREESQAKFEGQNAQNTNSREVTKEIGQKANQSVSSKDAKARQLVQAKYDLAVAQADLQLAEAKADRKAKGEAFTTLALGCSMGVSYLGTYWDMASSKGEVNSGCLGEEDARPSFEAARKREIIDHERTANGREVAGGEDGITFEDVPDKDPPQVVAKYTVRAGTTEAKVDPLTLPAGADPAAFEAEARKTICDAETAKGNTVEGGAAGISFKPVAGHPDQLQPVYKVATPETKIDSKPMNLPKVAAEEGKKSGFWGSLGSGTMKWVVMPALTTVSENEQLLKATLNSHNANEQAQSELTAARQKRDAAARKLADLQAQLENF